MSGGEVVPGLAAHHVDWLLAAGLSLETVRDLVAHSALGDVVAVRAAARLGRYGLSGAEVLRYARTVGLVWGEVVESSGVSVEAVRPLAVGGVVAPRDFPRLMLAVEACGIRVEDVPLWARAGVVVGQPPFVNERLWRRWCAVGVHRLGLGTAAAAAAAGLSPEEAVAMHESGSLSRESLLLLAGLV